MINLVIVCAIFIAIVIGYKTKMNIGLIAMVFAYFIGTSGLGLKPKEIVALWPMSIFFVIFSVSLFYNFAAVNGTMDKLANVMLYHTRDFPDFLPLIIFFASALVAGLGAGFFTVMAVFCPMTLMLCEKSNQNLLLGAAAVNWGALAGANLMTSGSGVVFQGLIKEAGYVDEAFTMGVPTFLLSLIYPAIILLIYLIFNRVKNGKKEIKLYVEKPEPFNKKQKQTIFLMILTVLLVLIFPLMHLIFPNQEVLMKLNQYIDIGLICILMSVIAIILDLGDQKKVMNSVPWNTIVMIGGMGMLIQVAIKAGLVNIIGNWIGSNVPEFFIPVVFALVAGAMSFFSSTLGVVSPSLFPMVVPIVQANPGLNPSLLFAAIVCGGQSSNLSPFSSGGSLIQGSCRNDEDRNWLFNKQIFFGVPLNYVFCAISVLILTSFYKCF